MPTVQQVIIEFYGKTADSYCHDGTFNVPSTTEQDHHGYEDAIGISNYRCLMDAWGNLDGVNNGSYYSCRNVGLRLDSPAPDDLREVLESIQDYPVLDENGYYAAEQELIDQDWEMYGKDEAIDHATPIVAEQLKVDSVDVDRDAVELIIDTLVGSGKVRSPERIDASYVDFHMAEMGDWIRSRIGTVVPIDGTVLDLRCANLVSGS